MDDDTESDKPSRLHSNDGRIIGDYKSRYREAWVQIIIELLVLLVFAIISVIGVGACLLSDAQSTSPVNRLLYQLQPWPVMAFAALAGGTTFALKWLYHAVAKAEWNRDRILWRFIVPLNSAVLGTAAGFGISSGIMPFLDQNSFDNVYAAIFFGFFIGHFSDHVLAALQRQAQKWFGTIDEKAK